MLLEPCSHIFWAYTHVDSKLNHMEKRVDKQCFAYLLQESINGGILRNANNDTVMRLSKPGYQLPEQDSRQTERIELLTPEKGIVHTYQSGK